VSSLFATDKPERTPVFVLTGFLGSGKSTLLNRLLRAPALADTAVIVNELGEVALDHLLVERIEGEVALLRSGCICCAVRGDFEDTLRELLARRDEGSLPPFARVVVETTGLADPAPLVQALDGNPLISHFCRLGAVLTTVDMVNAPAQLAQQWEARKQVALADVLLLTKTDLAAAAPALLEALEQLNPQAERVRLDADTALAPLLQARATHTAVEQALHLLAGRPIGPLHGEVTSFVLRADTPLDWPRLQAWLAALRAEHGENLLRLKGVVAVQGEPAPLVLHGVQHLFHPPLAAPALRWPAGHSALVLIVRGLDPGPLREGFARCLA
jgi:G3E family GTPase